MRKKMFLLTFTLVITGIAAIQMAQGQADNPATYYNSGLQKSNRGQYKAAISDFNKAIRIKPNYGKAYIGRGIAKDAIGQHLEAIGDYNKAISLDLEDAEDLLAYYKRGLAKYNTGQYIQAVSDLDVVIRRKPDFANAYYNRGLAKSILAQYEEAISDFNEAIQLKTGFFEAYYNRGLTHYKVGKMYSAISDFDMALLIKSGDTDAQNNRTMAEAVLKATGTCRNLDPPRTKVTPNIIERAKGQAAGVKAVTLKKEFLWRWDVTDSREDDGNDNGGPLILTVKFLNGTPEEKNDVREIAPIWSKYAYIDFVFLEPGESGESDIRINFEGNHGYNSYVGIYNKAQFNENIHPKKQTMNLSFRSNEVYESDNLKWKEGEIRRAILHEFGHALGFKHEHMHPELKIDWNFSEENGVYPYYRASQRWPDEKIKAQVIDRLDPRHFDFSKFDEYSIMIYSIKEEEEFPVLINKDTGKEIETVGKTTDEIQKEVDRIIKEGGEVESEKKKYKILNTPFEAKRTDVLSASDQAAAARMYPGRFGPPTESGNGIKTYTFTHSEKPDRTQFLIGDPRDWNATYALPNGELSGCIVLPFVTGNAGLESAIINEKKHTLELKGWVEDGTFVRGEIELEISISYYPPAPPPEIIVEPLEPPSD